MRREINQALNGSRRSAVWKPLFLLAAVAGGAVVPALAQPGLRENQERVRQALPPLSALLSGSPQSPGAASRGPVAYVADSGLSRRAVESLFYLQTAANACDLNVDGLVNDVDVQWAIDMALGARPCTANILGSGICNVIVVQRILNAKTGACVIGSSRRVELTWTASTSSNVAGYSVFRGISAGGPYTKLNTTLVAGTSFLDSAVQSGQTYYYVVTAVDTSNNSSVYSNEATAVVP